MKENLEADAAALDEVAAAADWLAGLAERDGEYEKAEETRCDAAVLRRWADLCRSVAAASE